MEQMNNCNHAEDVTLECSEYAHDFSPQLLGKNQFWTALRMLNLFPSLLSPTPSEAQLKPGCS